MANEYRVVQWNRAKRVYDVVVLLGVVLYVAGFVVVSGITAAEGHRASDEILVIRAFGSCAIILLHIILCIGPLARLSRRFSPLLYNRRHLGVTTFFVGLIHGALALVWYHGFGNESPFVSVFASNARFDTFAALPFEPLGVAALGILLVMAATSHDFWLANLSPAVWKSLHMSVYFAYALLILHVALGALQSERDPGYVASLGAGLALVVGLHLAAGLRERRADRTTTPPAEEAGWIDGGDAASLREGCGRVLRPAGSEGIAVFRHGGAISALTNVCAHQGGPLGEGRVIDGCVTCPWHGYQYRPADGRSPPPFTERIATHPVRVRDGRIEVRTEPLPPGTHVEPAAIEGSAS